ncbi:MAG: hypothetical protein ABIN58_13435 [candidate division WOR-3 bacterium]
MRRGARFPEVLLDELVGDEMTGGEKKSFPTSYPSARVTSDEMTGSEKRS